jgi:RNA recognition motif-containing protein
MTTMNTDNNYDLSRTDQMSSSAVLEDGYIEHQNSSQKENDSGSGSSGSLTGSKPEDERKLFVGGLTWDITQEDLREYFSSFGNVLDCSIKHDPSTGRSRGFAFLVFDSKDIVEKILSQNEHFIKGRKIDPKTAHRRLNQTNNINNYNLSSQSSLYSIGSSTIMSYPNMATNMGANSNPYNNNRKVFIGGLDPNFPDSQLREYFSKFGKIEEIDLPYDKEKNERRPFCFISFQTEQAAQEVLQIQKHNIGDMSVDVKPAKPKTLNNQQQQQKLQKNIYDPYGQYNAYASYGTNVPSYGANAYSSADRYAHWNAYTYNQQANPATYPYGSSSSTSAPSSTYSQYSDHKSNSQYSYPSNLASTNDYYSRYGYDAAQSSNVYGDPNTYGSYDYGSYYPPLNSAMVDNSTGQQQQQQQQQSGNSPSNQIDYEHDNHYGKAKTSIVSSPTYHPYSRS